MLEEKLEEEILEENDENLTEEEFFEEIMGISEDLMETEEIIDNVINEDSNLYIELTNNEADFQRIKHDETLTEYQKEMMLEAIAEKNIKLVYYVANKMATYSLPLDELIDVGMMGYAKAFKHFNPDKGVMFTTFAVSCIKHDIYAALKKEEKHYQNDISISATKTWDKNGNEMTILDTLADSADTGEDLTRRETTQKEVRSFLDKLQPVEKFTLYSRFGMHKGPSMTQKDVAKYMGMSQANVSKIERTVLADLKEMMTGSGLEYSLPNK